MRDLPANTSLQEHNTVYTIPEPRLPHASISHTFARGVEAYHTTHVLPRPSHPAGLGTNAHTSSGDCLAYVRSFLSRFGNIDIANAHVIGQVDRKFIACVLEPELNTEHPGELSDKHSQLDDHFGSRGAPVLVLFDQHAAHERVRVERFLKELCDGFLTAASSRGDRGVSSTTLSKPIAVQLTIQEHQKLVSSDHHYSDVRRFFSYWGIQFSSSEFVDETSPGMNDREQQFHSTIEVLTVPEGLSDKVCVAGLLLLYEYR